MHDSFWWDVKLGDFLFRGLAVENVAGLVITCLVFVLLTIIFEGLKVLETKMRRDHSIRMRRAMQGVCADDRSNLLRRDAAGSSTETQNAPSASRVLQIKFGLIASQVLLYTTNTSLNYIIMLAVMMYNGYLVIAIILGIVIGYYLFGHVSAKYCIASVREKSSVVRVCVPDCEEPDGSTPPLLQGIGASADNLYRAQSQRLLNEDSATCSQTKEKGCCSSEASTGVKKTTDVSKIKVSKEASGSKCCEQVLDEESALKVVSEDSKNEEMDNEKSKACCDRDRKKEETEKTVESAQNLNP